MNASLCPILHAVTGALCKHERRGSMHACTVYCCEKKIYDLQSAPGRIYGHHYFRKWGWGCKSMHDMHFQYLSPLFQVLQYTALP